MGFSPQFVDLDGDGNKDIISGGYPGELYLFAGNGDGTFRAREDLMNRNGEKINVGNSSVPFATDWDRDGDMDLLVGNIDGEVHFIPNESGGASLQFGQPIRIITRGENIKPDAGDAGVHVTDWDGDGNHDLLVGLEDGSVLFYRNTTDRGLPRLADPVEFIQPNYRFTSERVAGQPNLGWRPKLCVADWNGDGRDDLLIGTYSADQGISPELTPDEEVIKNGLNQSYEEHLRRSSERKIAIQNAVRNEMGLAGQETIPPDRRREFVSKSLEALNADSEYQRIQSELRSTREEMEQYLTPNYTHGWVWVLLRK